MQINRLFEIIYILLDKKRVSARELAAHFGVSRQTIGRDVNVLSTAGIPIYTERGKGGGISLLPNFVLNKSILSEHEQNKILSALHGLTSVRADDAEILQKLSTMFNKPMPNWLEVDFSEWGHDDGFFNGIKDAIVERRIVEFDYYNREEDKSFRRIEPVQLLFKSKAWYLKGFCLAKQDIRLFKLRRIRNPVITDEHFDERDLPAVSENFSANIDAKITLKLRIAPEMAYRLHDDYNDCEIEKQADGSFIVTETIAESNWLYGYLLSYGKYVEILEPEHIRNIVKEEAQEILHKYL